MVFEELRRDVRVIRMLTGGALRLVLAGSMIGLVLAVAVSRLLGGLLFDVNVLDPVTFLTVPVVLGSAALL